MREEPFDAESAFGRSSAGRFISRICCSTALTTAGESSTSAWIEKRADSLPRKPGIPSSSKENDSRGLPRWGGSKAAFKVGLIAIRDKSWSASRKLLFRPIWTEQND